MHLLHRFANADAADGDSWQVEVRHRSRAQITEVGETTALHNPEEGLVVALMGVCTAAQPGMGAPASLRNIIFCGWIGRALIKGHGHIGTKAHLDLHRPLGGQQDAAAVARVAEVNPFIVNAVEVAEAEHLEASGIGEHRAVPAHEPMQPSGFRNDLLPRL